MFPKESKLNELVHILSLSLCDVLMLVSASKIPCSSAVNIVVTSDNLIWEVIFSTIAAVPVAKFVFDP